MVGERPDTLRNGSFRDECLNLHRFETLDQAKKTIEAWRIEYNESRPHQSLNDLTPSELILQFNRINKQLGPQHVENYCSVWS